MAIKDIFKVSRKTFINPKAWLGYDSLVSNTKTLKTFVTDAMTVQKPTRTETFEEALERLDIKEKDLPATIGLYLTYAYFFLGLAIIDLIYGVYLLFHHHTFLGMVLALVVCGLLLSQAFRYHFWVFQIQKRKLGCTFEEWRDSILGKKE